jgi:predicted outer membrane protein
MYKLLAVTVVAVSFATPVVAQSVPEKTGVNSTLGISPSTQDFVIEAANSNMLEIESSKLVAARGDAKDKAFAGRARASQHAGRRAAGTCGHNRSTGSDPPGHSGPRAYV